MSRERHTQLDCEEASEFITPRKQTIFPRVKAGIALAAIAGAVCLAATYSAGVYPFQQEPWAQFERVQSQMLEAFSLRQLSEGPSFKTSVEIVLKEQDQRDPGAMSINVKLHSHVAQADWPKVVMTLEAKKNKEHKLKKKCKAIWEAIKDQQCGDDQKCMRRAPPLKISANTHSSHFGNGSWVFLELALPHSDAGKATEKDLEAALKDNANPDIHAEISVGRTIQEMFQNENDNMAVLAGGISATMSAAFASTAFKVFSEGGMSRMINPGMVKMMTGLAKIKNRQEIVYKKPEDLGDAFDDIPTLKREMKMVRTMLQRQPANVTKHLQGLESLMEGISGVVANGLRDTHSHTYLELIAMTKNFHPAPLLTEILEEVSHRK